MISSVKNKTFNNGRTGAETSLGSKELTTLPTISRSASDFYRLDPSASGGSFGGRNDQFNNFTLDGSVFNNPFGLDAATPGGQTDAQPISLDAIEQIQVSTAPYDVSLSGFTGAAVNAVTKSGTNEFHGTAYGFYRNQDFTGDKVKGDKIFVPELSQKQYGASIGGPIVKDKVFFFANFEKDDRIDAGSNWVPNNNDGVQGINETINPNHLADMQAVSNALLTLGYDTGAIQGFTHDSGSTKGIFKLDFNLSEKNKLALIYNFLDASKEKPAHPTAITRRGPNATTLQFENSGYEINNKINSFLAELNSSFTDNISNKFQLGYTAFNDFRNPKSTPAPSINIQDGNGVNYIIAGHEPFSIHNKLHQKVFQVSDKLDLFLNKHNVSVGFNFEKFMFENSFNLTAYGFSLFGNYADINAFNTAVSDGSLAAEFANVQASDASLNAAGEGVAGGWNLSKTNVGQLAFYIQDEISVSDDFKLTLGLRADKPMYFNTDKLTQDFIDTQCCYDPSIDYYDPSNGNVVHFDSTKMPTNSLILSPRLGFNWDANGDKSMQVRGGTGVFTGRFPFVWLGNQTGNVNSFFYQVVDPDFEWPRVWKSSIGIDKKFKSGLVATVDMAYTKDIKAAHVQNWGLESPSLTLNGVDNRPIYANSDKHNNAYVFTNSNKGYAFNTTLKVAKTFNKSLYASVAYNFNEAKSVNSIEAEITGDAFDFNPISGNANDDVLSHSKYGDKHRFIGVASKKWNYGTDDKWGTTISTFVEYAQGGRFSYTYAGNINNDSSFQNNDLIYIPTESELNSMTFSGPGQAALYNDFIKQDDYLSEHRGSYAERYGALSPWRSKWDVFYKIIT